MIRNSLLLFFLMCVVASASDRLKVSDNSEETAVRDAVEAAARAFTAEDLSAYQACFKESRRASVRRRTAVCFVENECSMEVAEMHVVEVGEEKASAVVKYRISSGLKQEVVAEVHFVKDGDGWLIDRENIKSKSDLGSRGASFVSAPARKPGSRHPEDPGAWDEMRPNPNRISPKLQHLMGDVGIREGTGCAGGRCANGRCEVR